MKQAKLIQMRQEAMEIQDRLMSSDIEIIKVAEKGPRTAVGAVL